MCWNFLSYFFTECLAYKLGLIYQACQGIFPLKAQNSLVNAVFSSGSAICDDVCSWRGSQDKL